MAAPEDQPGPLLDQTVHEALEDCAHLRDCLTDGRAALAVLHPFAHASKPIS